MRAATALACLLLFGCGGGAAASSSEAPNARSEAAHDDGPRVGLGASPAPARDPIWGACKPRHWSVGSDASFPYGDPGRKHGLLPERGNPHPMLLPDDGILLGTLDFVYRRDTDTYDPVLDSAESDPWSIVTLLGDGKTVLVAGGGLADAHLLDLESKSFRSMASMNEVRNGSQAAVLPDGRILLYGGAGNGPSEEVWNIAEIYDPNADRWTVVDLPRLSDGVTGPLNLVSLQSGDVLIVGVGLSGIFRWKTSTFEAMPALPHRLGPGAATLLTDGRVLVAGGERPFEGVYGVTDALIFDADARTWTATSSTNHPRRAGHHLLRLPCGSVLAFGGVDGALNVQTAIELYDPVAETWTDLPELPENMLAGAQGVVRSDGRVVITYGAKTPADGAPIEYRPLFLDE